MLCASECDNESKTMRKPWSTTAIAPWSKKDIIYINMDLEELGRGCGDWMGSAQDRDRWRAFVSTVMNFAVP